MSVCTTIFWQISCLSLQTEVNSGCCVQMKLNCFGNFRDTLADAFPDAFKDFQRDLGITRTYPSLGWISIGRSITVKKLLFLRTILVMTDDSICKHLLIHRAAVYSADSVKYSRNESDNAIFEISNVCEEFEILEICQAMNNNRSYLSKTE